MMSSKNNGFTAGDIERYHSGKMSPEERHALEKAALDDPFLADALEGYAFTSSPSADLAKIQSRLDEKKDNKKVIPIFQKYKWLSVAAIVLIIVGAGWLVFSITGKGNGSVAVTNRETSKANDSNQTALSNQNVRDTQNTASALNAPSITEQDQRQTAGQSPKTNSGTLANQSQKQLSKEKKAVSGKKEIVSELTTQNIAQSNAASNNLAAARSRNVQSNTFTPDAKVNDKKEGFFSTFSNKDVASNNAPLSGKTNGINQNDTIKNMNIVLQPLPADSMAMREVVVVGYGAQRKSATNYPHVTIDTLEPAEGYVHFDDYVANNIKLPDEYKAKTTSGEVQLSFDVDKNGQPVNITVVKSLCDKCDEEAVRLLKEGPKWKKNKNKKGKITIKF